MGRATLRLRVKYIISRGLSQNIQYLNRLSDLLFVLGRWFNKKNRIKEVAGGGN